MANSYFFMNLLIIFADFVSKMDFFCVVIEHKNKKSCVAWLV